MTKSTRRVSVLLVVVVAVASAALLTTQATAHADNKRLNDSVVVNVYTTQHQAGCTNDVNINPQLQFAAQRHTEDLLNHRDLDGEIGSDSSNAQDRANAAGYRGTVAETVAINPAMAINSMEILNKWYSDPVAKAIMSNCANTQMGVWSANSPDRTVVVAVYGQPLQEDLPRRPPEPAPSYDTMAPVSSPIDPNPDYDASDELEYGINWFAWILRGNYPPPAYPPQ